MTSPYGKVKKLGSSAIFHHFSGFKPSTVIVAFINLLFCFFVSTAYPTPDSANALFQEGVYAEYRFDSGSIVFTNGTFFDFPASSRAEVTFRWQCVYVVENICRLNVSLLFKHEARVFWFSVMLDVNIEDRSMRMPNGTFIGITFLWLPPKLEPNQTINITNGVIGNVSAIGFADSPQMLQKAFWVEGVGQINGKTIAPGGGYDWDTGFLLQSGFWGEPALMALGILDPGVVGATDFTSTNIDLGPGKPILEEPQAISSEVLFVVISIVVFNLIFLTVFKRRKRQRKAAKAKRFTTGLVNDRRSRLGSYQWLLVYR